jgi:pre-rRNA-processing protein TSR2
LIALLLLLFPISPRSKHALSTCQEASLVNFAPSHSHAFALQHIKPYPAMTTSPTIALFARGTLAILNLWPALTIAVREEWGGPESADKKTWIASTIIDEFESRASYLPSSSEASSSSSSNSQVVDPATANDPPLDYDDLADMLNQMMSDEFESNIEDGSIDAVASDLVRLWRDILQPGQGLTASSVVEALERKAGEGKSIQATKGAGLQTVDGDSDSDWDDESDDEGMEVDQAPQLVPATTERERQEPVVDDDGFTMVQAKGKKSGR